MIGSWFSKQKLSHNGLPAVEPAILSIRLLNLFWHTTLCCAPFGEG